MKWITFFLEKILPNLVYKCFFSIYIFDSEHYESKKTPKLYIHYDQKLNKFYNTNSLYILNKIDLTPIEEKDSCIKKFEKFLIDELNVNLEKNSVLELNSNQLFNKVNAYSSLKNYILYIIDEINEEDKNNDLFGFIDYIKEKMVDNFPISKEEFEKIMDDTNLNNYKDDQYNEKEYDEIMTIIRNKNLNPELEEEHYRKILYIFKKYNFHKISHFEEIDNIYKKIIDCMIECLNTFLDFNKVKELIIIFEEFLIRKTKNNKIYIKICIALIDSFEQNLKIKKILKDNKTKWNIDEIASFHSIIKRLIIIDSENNLLKQLERKFTSLSYFFYNYRKIRIPILGGYSSGKSSFLNSLIGQDILPVDINKCTYKGIIIRHNKNGNLPQLFKTKFLHIENPNYWYFKDEENYICEGYENVKKKLEELNHDKNENINFEDAFVILKVPLKLFSEIDFSENENLKLMLEDKLELIDFPGLDVKNNYYEDNIFIPLMNFSDGFIFVNECNLINESSNLQILDNILKQIINRDFSFSFK